jgi:hypothetical protein
MKHLGIRCGTLIESFVLLPSIDFSWMSLKSGTYYDLRFAWLFWYITIGEINNRLKEDGYY